MSAANSVTSLLNALMAALRGMSANRLRTVLTMLGVIIGVASVMATQALGAGARAAVDANFRFLGSDQVQINAEFAYDHGQMKLAGKTLTYEDGLGLPEAAPLIDRAEMAVHGSAKVRQGHNTLDTAFTGTDAGALITQITQGQVQPVGWPTGKPLTAAAFIGQGRFYSDAEVAAEADVCVLGYQTAQDLFLGDDPIGATVWVNRTPCEVIGVLTELEAVDVSQRATGQVNDALYVPISMAVRNLFDEDPWVTVIAHVRDESKMDQAETQIKAYLRQRHGIEQSADGKWTDDFRLTTKQDVLGAQQEAAGTFALLLTALAAVSLIVGGIGIMNVMLVSVSERTREIGLRRAVGARQWDIVLQFLLEAVALSLTGGLLGVAVGVLAIPLAAALNNGAAILDPRSIPLAMCVALATGVVFGIYPALAAARLDPIEALRYE